MSGVPWRGRGGGCACMPVSGGVWLALMAPVSHKSLATSSCGSHLEKKRQKSVSYAPDFMVFISQCASRVRNEGRCSTIGNTRAI